MRLYLALSLVLLISPMALAELPITVATRLIYDNNFVIIETKETREVAYSIRTNPTYKTTNLDLHLGPLAGISIDGVLPYPKNSADQTNLTFVAEVMLLPNGSRYPEFGFNCFNETDESLRHLIKPGFYTNCWGASRLRKLTQEETDQMNKFKSSPEGKFKVIFDSNLANGNFDRFLANGNLTSQSSGLDHLELSRRRSRLEVTAEEEVYKNGNYKGNEKRSINLFRYEDKSFAIEGTKENVDCKNTDVEELWVVKCQGNIRARSLKDGDLPKLI